MGMFDDALKNSVPGGNLATPIAVAVGALILGKLFGGGSSPAPAPSAPMPNPMPASVPANPPTTSVVGGLGDLIGRLTAGGAGQQVNSWVGPGQNQPIEPGQLGGALGGGVLEELSKRTGMCQQEMLSQLAARPAAADQQPDAQGPRADGRRSRAAVRVGATARGPGR